MPAQRPKETDSDAYCFPNTSSPFTLAALRAGVTPDDASSAVSRDLRPVAESERVVTLDMLRGLAVLGMLLANVTIFGWADGAGAPSGVQPTPARPVKPCPTES